ncbi:DNA polymerase III subunit beta [Aromatoleum evansii]|uniref:Beta sliding clamp n=1 Tax=Aromatoleum evansii TaxID=59406 RepID=A0ABZ1ALV0_AROEV|nr:DNA polymerase III subunit beta [Aromatoleum evansii]NMG32028.1 DNA polymerase III subunit beta [Aromatoleum evansii]WRL46460.1 DNA polymerase III subunit beta [Aromatoleum evansii]
MLLLTTTRDALLAPLQSVAGIVEKRHTLPILSNVLIEKHGDQLTLLATDIEIQIRTTTGGHIGGEDANITVAAKKLQDILRALPNEGEVVLTLDDKRLTVKAGRSRFALQTLPAADYPRMNLPDGDATRFSISQKSFKRQLAQVAYSMAQQDIRYYLNGLLLIADGKELRMVATDGHRLAFASSPLEAEVPRTEVILPRKTVMELARQLADSEDPLEIVLAGNQVVFRFGPIELVSKLIDGKFPDYERVIPQNHQKLITFERVPLLATLSRVAILTNDKFRGVRLVLGDGTLKIASTNAEQEEAQEELEVDYHGDPLDIGFNVTYLLDVLTNIHDDQVEWRFNDGNSSALVTLPGNDRFKYVVMPMRI